MKGAALIAVLAGFAVLLLGVAFSHASPGRDRAASLAAFDAMATVMTSPRCMNCHTLTGFPRQGDDRHPHLFGVSRGPDNAGAVGLRCVTCHGRANDVASGAPGADEAWRLAPLSMGWEGLSGGQLCRHLKDPARNGHRTGAAVIEHLRTHLVMWAWSPGTDSHGRARTPPPVAYDAFLRAAQAWVAGGEACPGPAA
jgi:mono/diheme cytochrome c family protein